MAQCAARLADYGVSSARVARDFTGPVLTAPHPARWKMALLLAFLSMVSPFSIDTFFP